MKRGKLTQQDKYIIQGMLSGKDRKSVEEIAKELDRTTASIQRYIDGELDDVAGHVTQAQMEAYEAKIQELQEKEKKLRQHTKNIKKQRDDAIAKLPPEARGEAAFKTAMIDKTDGGKEGVSVMTQTASEIADKEKSRPAPEPRKRNTIYKIKEQEIV